MKRFILDMCRDYVAIGEEGEEIDIPRFSVWAVRRKHKDGKPIGGSQPVVIAVDVDLERLLEEHGDLPLFRIEDMEERIHE